MTNYNLTIGRMELPAIKEFRMVPLFSQNEHLGTSSSIMNISQYWLDRFLVDTELIDIWSEVFVKSVYITERKVLLLKGYREIFMEKHNIEENMKTFRDVNGDPTLYFLHILNFLIYFMEYAIQTDTDVEKSMILIKKA